MKKYACVLAAGRGSRLKKITEDSSKWMVEVNNLSLMERYLIAFKTNNIENIIVVLGHASQNLKESLLRINKNLNLNLIFIKNDLFDKTNNIFSLNIALKEILKIKDLDRLIIAECDIFFARGSIDKFLNLDIGNHILASPYEYWMDGSCISLDDNDRIKSLLNKNEVIKSKSKNLFKTVNWYSFDKEYIQNQLAPFINTYSTNISAVSYYELVIKILLQISEVRLDLFKIHPSKWVEIDDSYDLQLAECFDDADNGNIKPFVNRYGGFWKFPWITDLTLLVNPYFPPKEMLKEIYKLNDVIGRNYPSSQEVLSNLVSKSFLVEKEEIIVANGVCEILMNILTKIKGDFEIKVPFFLEYSRSLGDKLIEVNELDDFSFKNNIIIVNPNNPDGEVLDLGIIKSIAKKLEKNGKYLIYDESFADFHLREDISLIKNPSLPRAKNIILLKSLGKTYGTPGIRLGILINSDYQKVFQWRKLLPIWNINSYAEAFLDLLPRYKKEYILSLEKVSKNTENFYSYLNKLEDENFKVYKPSSNFILVSFNSLSLLNKVELALFKNHYLSKSLICRKGLPKYSMRIAVLEDHKNFEVASLLNNALRDL